MPEIYHIPALLTETVDNLCVNPDGIYVDATFGGGGHSRAILERLSPQGRLIAFDQDSDAMANCPEDPRFTFVHSNFRYLENFLRYHGVDRVDGILADMGVSFHHFDDASRGFSFREEAPLDMRMNRLAPRSAADIVNTCSPDRLREILHLYGDLKNAGQFAKAIEKARQQEPILTTTQLVEAVRPVVDPRREKKELAQVFQALRMEVNGETDALREFLAATPRVLKPDGRLAILTYHSVEDRMVKNFMRAGNMEGRVEKDFFGNALTPWRLVTRQPIAPTEAEIEANPRARSAKLRVAQLNPLTPNTQA